ncbi:acyl-CoA dehydrogenase family protein [Streptomyces sp. HUAS MG47]|uniref:acyl-CoA dehydrogenase family protein n=1 Tax=Streptomyces solicamelliae TaxID=3231716 RepID=UPI003877F77D
MRDTPEQSELRASVRSLLARHEGHAAWRPLTEQIGAAALAVPEEQGGLGCGLPEQAVVAEESGRALSPLPYLGSAVLAATALAEAAAPFPPGLAAGTRVAALAWAEAGGWEPEAITTTATRAASGGEGGPDAGGRAAASGPAGAGVRAPAAAPPRDDASGRTHAAAAGGLPGPAWYLTGVKEYVLAGPGTPDHLYAFARTGSGGRLGLFALDGPGVGWAAVPALDRTRPLGRVVLDRAHARLLCGDGERVLARVRDVGAVALAAECVGAAGRALELTVRYAKDRVQFGRPIGAFQAVKHRLADLHAEVEGARSLARAAAHADGTPAFPRLAAAAKSACTEAYRTVAAETVQLHGGIGITWEHPAHDHLKRAHGAALLLGSPEAHRARLATLLGLNAA